MTTTPVHLLTTPTRALCGRTPTYWTRDPLAVTCPTCDARMDTQPA